jgi:AcrR family transcriptional regulator
MRVKSEERRMAIMEAAAELFRVHGFHGTSMAMISALVGGSKATLYNYFSSKEELFAAVTIEAVDSTANSMIGLLEGDVSNIRETLMQFGRAYLDLILSPDVVMVTKIGISHGIPAELGPQLYESGPAKGWRTIAAALQRFHDKGLINTPNPQLAALQLKALLEAGMFEPVLFGSDALLDIETAVEHAVDLFLLKWS